MGFALKLEHDSSLKKPQKLFFILFGILFLVAPFYYQPNLGGEGLYIPFNSTIWIAAGWIIATASFIVVRTDKLILPKYWFGLALLPIGTLITGYIADNNNPTEWLVRVSVIISGYLFLIALFQFNLTSRHIERSLYLIIAAGIIHAGYGLLQTETNLGQYGLFPVSAKGQLIGMFQQVNLQASFMATLLILAFYLISRPTLSSLSPVIKIALFTAVFLASYTISVSGSRVGLLGAALGFLILMLGRWRQLLSAHARTTFIIALCCMLAGTLIDTSGLEKATNKADRAIGGMEKDVRWKVYDLSWQLYKEAPLFGHGLGSFQKVFQDKRAEYQKIEGNSLGTNPRFTHPHNEIIFWVVEGGIFAIIGIAAAAVVTFMQLAQAGWQRGMAYAALLIPIVLHTQVELPFYISNTHWFLVLFLLFLTHQFGKKEISTHKLSIAAHKSIPVFFIVLFALSNWVLVQSQVANAGIISYLKRNQSQPIFIVEGLKSIYFRDFSEYLYYRRVMYIELKKGNTEATHKYIEWANEALKTSPSISIYKDLAIAYHGIKRFELRDAVLQEAQMMYNRDKSLDVLQEKLLKQEEKQRLNLSNPSLKQGADVSQALPQANQQ